MFFNMFQFKVQPCCSVVVHTYSTHQFWIMLVDTETTVLPVGSGNDRIRFGEYRQQRNRLPDRVNMEGEVKYYVLQKHHLAALQYPEQH